MSRGRGKPNYWTDENVGAYTFKITYLKGEGGGKIVKLMKADWFRDAYDKIATMDWGLDPNFLFGIELNDPSELT